VTDDYCEKPIVTMLKTKLFPMYLLQIHPERTTNEWFDSCVIPHTNEAMLLAEEMANYFIEDARKNSHRFESEEELQRLIIENSPIIIVPYNKIPVYFMPKYEIKTVAEPKQNHSQNINCFIEL